MKYIWKNLNSWFPLESSERCEGSEHPMGDGTNINQTHIENIRIINPKSLDNKGKNNDYNRSYDENSESNNLSNDKYLVALSKEHTQHS